ncbi:MULTISPECIES: phosphatase PAP2 family protein [unclassified Streptomyces]|uniref:phosphatase PAP2 family protein n=1 Tax=unclassified Streptomyces TaxID=2593676 RepID=UPI002365CA3F|nr:MULTISPECIES: phosphatase PAP2 family protein [unclassified Streptomyces]MDF3145690.1 phosphatase PAP2 family protein [Streptomyces sp. T21Q-yed]WDF35990.1 phosphatase PAP2 family protein [Streptomyces sp. T12]
MHTQSVESPPRPPAERGTARWAGALALCSALLLALVAVRWYPLMTLDGDIAETTHHWAVDETGVTHTFRILTDWVWDPWTMRILSAAVAIWLVWRRAARWTAVWLVATCALATVIQQALKAVVDRPRPVWPDPVDSAHYASFPSGHAMTATVVCGLLLWLLHHYGVARALWRTAAAVAVISVAGVGLTRVWLGVHWATDVVGGWLLGALVVVLAVRVHARLQS